jgi:hypothetical protein
MKRNRLCLIAFLLILSLPFCLAYEEKLYDDWLYSGNSSTTSKSTNFTLYINDDELSVMLILPFGSVIVQNASCTERNNLSICYLGTAFGYYEPGRYDSRYGTTFTRWTLLASLSDMNITRSFEKTEMLVGQSSKVTVTMIGSGEAVSENVSYWEYYPTDMFSIMPGACIFTNNNITWTGRIYPAQTKECSYTLVAKKNGSYSSTMNVQYYDGMNQKGFTDTKTITVLPKRMTAEVAYPKNISVGTEFNLSITLYALENITVQYFEVQIPPGYNVLSQYNVEGRQDDVRSVKIYTYTGKIDKDKNASIRFELRAEANGNRTLKTRTHYLLPSFYEEFQNEYTLSSAIPAPYIRLSKTQFSQGDNTVEVFAVNPSEAVFNTIFLSANSPLAAEASEDFQYLKPNTHQSFNYRFNAVEGVYKLNISLSYSSEFLERFTINKLFTITVGNAQNPETGSNPTGGDTTSPGTATGQGSTNQASQGSHTTGGSNQTTLEKAASILGMKVVGSTKTWYMIAGVIGVLFLITTVMNIIISTRKHKFKEGQEPIVDMNQRKPL